MKIIVTTSNKYLHILPIFCFLFNKFWDKDQPVEIVGYDRPSFPLPSNKSADLKIFPGTFESISKRSPIGLFG
jgi:hypothetical protein